MNKKIIFAMLTGIVLLCLSGCASTGGAKSESSIKKEIKNSEFLGPKEGALLFGHNVVWSEFLQQNPEYGYKLYKTNWRDESTTIVLVTIVNNMTFLEPLPVGSELKLYKTSYYSGNTHYTDYYGIAGVDIVLNKPGLFFYGDNYEEKDRAEAELKALEILYKYFKGTGSEWETEIVNRMEELKNAK